MKFIHLSDLHLGKRVNGFSMIEDQEYILKRILQIVDKEEPQAVLIAGDVYDKAVPSGEAVSLLDDFLFRLAERGLAVMLIAGNHDSPERLAFGGRLMQQSGVYISPVYDGKVKKVVLKDAFGTVNFWLLPFVKPVNVRAILGDAAQGVDSYTDALRAALSQAQTDFSQRNVLLCHQFVTGAGRCDSEDISVGGLDNVDGAVFEGFDYVALGHLHGPQHACGETVRYCGTPLKYSFSEKDQTKSITLVTIKEKGHVDVKALPLKPRRDLREVRGSYEEVVHRAHGEGEAREDYIKVVLTDEDDVPDAMQKIRTVYPHVMVLEHDNARTRARAFSDAPGEAQRRSAEDLIAEFYERQNGLPMNDAQTAYSRALLERIREDER